ncbi:hypothetical protein A3Q56_02418 [Intoshia linei]|uniref:Uncharacterized protein n=1 Tax=Intoshia linei TaxID=1819745 RepID=A0A177B7W7_9BILA|nr:hypothetical protein A3Q56_02418 [Intoshia linei]
MNSRCSHGNNTVPTFVLTLINEEERNHQKWIRLGNNENLRKNEKYVYIREALVQFIRDHPGEPSLEYLLSLNEFLYYG